jgi:hypothetical protein
MPPLGLVGSRGPRILAVDMRTGKHPASLATQGSAARRNPCFSLHPDY